MFDDPNLHSPTYGFISFSDLADHARANRYHAAMATVPLDGYWFNERAAAVFRENPRYISILIHGNNHTEKGTWTTILCHATDAVGSGVSRQDRTAGESGGRQHLPCDGRHMAGARKQCWPHWLRMAMNQLPSPRDH